MMPCVCAKSIFRESICIVWGRHNLGFVFGMIFVQVYVFLVQWLGGGLLECHCRDLLGGLLVCL